MFKPVEHRGTHRAHIGESQSTTICEAHSKGKIMKNINSFVLVGSALVFALLNPELAVGSDLKIYEGASQDTPAIMLMLDTSGSMAAYDVPALGFSGNTLPNACTVRNNSSSSNDYNKYKWTIEYGSCPNSLNNPAAGRTNIFKRIDSLKMAVWDVAEDLASLEKGEYKVGVGTYPNPKFTGTAFNNNLEEWAQGAISVPALLMTPTHKQTIQNYVAGISANAGTPLANGYAEAAAYMLGTTTGAGTTAITPNYRVNDDRGNNGEDLYRCTSVNKSRIITRGKDSWYECASEDYVGSGSCRAIENFIRNQWNVGFGSKSGGSNCRYNGDYYYGTGIQPSGNEAYSGFRFSDNSSKDGSVYKSPLEGTSSECGAHGIFLLTDGVPNGSSNSISKYLMDKALGSPNTVSCNGSLLAAGDSDTGWKCMGDFSQSLLNKKNKGSKLIKTATVGFGADYAGLKASGSSGSGSQIDQTFEISDCSSYTDVNRKNLCLLGVAGKGGFYYASNRDGVVESVKSFLGTIDATVPPISTGTMAVPVDVLDLVGDTKSIYLPVLEPLVGKQQLWPGNLKKYAIDKNKIVGENDNAVFDDNKGNFADDTTDFWSFTGRPDKKAPQIGGSFSQVFKNQFVDTDGKVIKEKGRRAYTDYIDSGTSKVALSNVKVTGTQLSGFTKLAGLAERTKIAILNYLGYPVTESFILNDDGTEKTISDTTPLTEDGEAITLDESIKVMGGVLHSTPQLITYKANFDDDGALTTREDYIIYGSMDGALHMVDNESGKEVFTFLPSQVLKSQGEVYLDKETTFSGQPHGVDGPWTTYVTYERGDKVFEANQVVASGGLRMGGSTQYALDLSDFNNPEIIYAVGSDYAENEYGEGLISAAPISLTGSNNAFKRMGQSWGKPTQGLVKYDGKEVAVNFLPGGYDACYEKPGFVLGSGGDLTCSKASAQGNAVYMMGLGELTTKDNQEVINLDSTNISGKLLWWTSGNTESDGSAQFTLQNALKHSVVTNIQALDRDYDGLTDHIYFADLGGQIFRADIDNRGDTFSVARVVRLLNAGGAKSGSDTAPRFYERPTVSFTRLGNKVVGLVTAGTGDRSSPLLERKTANRLYNLIDKDVAKNDLFTNPNVIIETKDIVPADTAGATAPKVLNQLKLTAADAAALKNNMDQNKAQGWFFVADRFKNTAGNKGLKIFNEQDVLKGFLYFNVYNPAGTTIAAGDTCSSGVRGSSERQILCLPYGNCAGFETRLESEASGTGIVDTWIVKSDGLIGRLSTDPDSPGLDEKAISNGSGSSGGSGTGAPDINSGFPGDRVLKPLEWLQKQ